MKYDRVPSSQLYELIESATTAWIETEAVCAQVLKEWMEFEQARADELRKKPRWRGREDRTPHQVEIVAFVKANQDMRRRTAIADGEWHMRRIQAAAAVLDWRDRLAQRRKRHDSASSVDGHRGNVRDRDRSAPATRSAQPTAPTREASPFDLGKITCTVDRCSGSCGFPVWDGPGISDQSERWQYIALHAVNGSRSRTSSSARPTF